MSRMSMVLSCLAAATIAVGLSGCGSAADPSQSPPAADQPDAGNGDDHTGHEHGGGDHAGHMPPSTEVEKALAELSPEDRTVAEKQRICPVTDEALGSMGEPCKVHVKGRAVLLCCRGCVTRLMNDPDRYLARLNP